MLSDILTFDASHQPGPDRPVVLVTWPEFESAPGNPVAVLHEAGLEVRLEPKTGRRTAAEMTQLVSGVSAAIVGADPFDSGIIAAAPELRVIARVGVGVEPINLKAATQHGVVVTVTPGLDEAIVADHAVALMLAILRRICAHDATVRSGDWKRTGMMVPRSLCGQTVGIIGYGRVGRLVARRLSGFDVEVLINDRRPIEITEGVVDLDELLKRSTVVSLHVPLTPTTHMLLGEREFTMMRDDAILVNTACGGIVDEGALERALAMGQIGGAAMDVFAKEPPKSAGLLGLSNVVLSPHHAGLSAESLGEMMRLATTSVVDVLRGEPPLGRLANPEVIKCRPPTLPS